MSGPPPLHQAIAVLDAGGQVRVARSRGYAIGLLVLGLLVGAGLLAWLVFAVADGLRRDRMGVVLAHPVTWASAVAVLGCAVLPVAVVAGLDALFGAGRAWLEGRFADRVFVTSFFWNVVVACLLVFLGTQLGVGSAMTTAVVVVLGIRIFSNTASIRRLLLKA